MHTFSTRCLAFVLSGIATWGLVAGLYIGWTSHPATVVHTQDTVTSYNDGWTDAMASQGLDANGHHLGR